MRSKKIPTITVLAFSFFMYTAYSSKLPPPPGPISVKEIFTDGTTSITSQAQTPLATGQGLMAVILAEFNCGPSAPTQVMCYNPTTPPGTTASAFNTCVNSSGQTETGILPATATANSICDTYTTGNTMQGIAVLTGYYAFSP